MRNQTTLDQRSIFYQLHQAGETYEQIAEAMHVSKECVRYWCRRQREGGSCQSRYQRQPAELLSHFDPKVGYVILRLRLAHPRWGPNRILARLKKRPSLRGLRLPKAAQIGRYLHQWPRFRRQTTQKLPHPRPDEPTQVHQCWQIDFKVGIPLADQSLVNLHTVRDPVGEACLGAILFPVKKVNSQLERVTLEQVRSVLRHCFTQWQTLPDEIQTDGEPVLVAQGPDPFPSPFSLWLAGLGIAHRVSRSGQPTDQAEVERCHRTITDFAIIGNEANPLPRLQAILDEAVLELLIELPSRAQGCAGRPPAEAHPELLQPRRAYRPEQEVALFDLKRVDAYLASFTWRRKVGQTGQIYLGGQHTTYSVGRTYAEQEVLIRFDPTDRHFVFAEPTDPEREIGRRPARKLEVADLTGLDPWPKGAVPQQLPLPLPIEG